MNASSRRSFGGVGGLRTIGALSGALGVRGTFGGTAF